MNSSSRPNTTVHQAPSSCATGVIATKEKESKRTPPAAAIADQSSSNHVHHVNQHLVPEQMNRIFNNSSVSFVRVIRSCKIERARSIARNWVPPDDESERIINRDYDSIGADMRHDKIEKARYIATGLREWRQSQQLDQQQHQPATATASASPTQATLLTRLEAKLLDSEKAVNELEEVIGAWVGAGVPVSLLRRHQDDDDNDDSKLLPGNNAKSAGAAAADDGRVLEKLLTFLMIKGGEHHKDHNMVV
jgi:hypothetical protein